MGAAIKLFPSRIAFCIAALGLAIVPRAANAIGACVCFDTPTGAPSFTRDMPLNPRIFASLKGADPATLRLMQGTTEVPIKTTDAGGVPYHLWVEPLSPLLAGTTYSLMVRSIANPNAGVSANDVELAYMETVVEPLPGSAGHDVTPPSIAGVTFAAGGLTDNCGPVASASTMNVATYHDDLAIGSTIVLQLDLDMGNGISKRMFVPHPGTFDHWSTGIGIGGSYSTGSDCLGDLRIPDGEAGKTYPLTVTAWDWSGNSSVTGSSFRLGGDGAVSSADASATPVQPSTGQGCRIGGGAGDSSFAYLLAGLVGLVALVRPRRRAPGHAVVVAADKDEIRATLAEMEDRYGPLPDAFHMPPGHDAWTEGKEACVLIDVTGVKNYAKPA